MLDIYIIATKHLWNRLDSLLSSEFVKGSDFSIISTEVEYEYTDYGKHTIWQHHLPHIAPGLLDNLRRIGYPPASCVLGTWADFRTLRKGDYSVLFKHLRALQNFLLSDNDFALILEDDAMPLIENVEIIEMLVTDLPSDFIDLAGGDGIKVILPTIHWKHGYLFECIKTRATRTACAYVISRRAALACIPYIEEVVFPIDWALSRGLIDLPADALVLWSDKTFFLHGSSSGNVTSWRK